MSIHNGDGATSCRLFTKASELAITPASWHREHQASELAITVMVLYFPSLLFLFLLLLPVSSFSASFSSSFLLHSFFSSPCFLSFVIPPSSLSFLFLILLLPLILTFLIRRPVSGKSKQYFAIN